MALHPISRPEPNPLSIAAARDERDARIGYEALVASRRLLSDAGQAIAREPNRMGAWRLVGHALEARKAFQVHTSICNSDAGPLMHLAESRPDLARSLQGLFDDHVRIFSALDQLISRATSTRGDNAESVAVLRATVATSQTHMAAYEGRFHDLAFEWANRDIGGEA